MDLLAVRQGTTRHHGVVVGLAALPPVAVCALLTTVRTEIATANAALILVLVVVAAASTGIRAASVTAALVGPVAFDFFLTAPYLTFTINNRDDVETAVLLVAVGIGVTEIALWGRRQRGRAARQQGYLAGVLQTVESVAVGAVEPRKLADEVAEQIRLVLGVDRCDFAVPGFSPPTGRVGAVRLSSDGQVTRDGRTLDVGRHGLPTDSEVELVVQTAGEVQGTYLITSATRIVRPTSDQLGVAVALADQVGAALASTDHTGAGSGAGAGDRDPREPAGQAPRAD